MSATSTTTRAVIVRVYEGPVILLEHGEPVGVVVADVHVDNVEAGTPQWGGELHDVEGGVAKAMVLGNRGLHALRIPWGTEHEIQPRQARVGGRYVVAFDGKGSPPMAP